MERESEDSSQRYCAEQRQDSSGGLIKQLIYGCAGNFGGHGRLRKQVNCASTMLGHDSPIMLFWTCTGSQSQFSCKAEPCSIVAGECITLGLHCVSEWCGNCAAQMGRQNLPRAIEVRFTPRRIVAGRSRSIGIAMNSAIAHRSVRTIRASWGVFSLEGFHLRKVWSHKFFPTGFSYERARVMRRSFFATINDFIFIWEANTLHFSFHVLLSQVAPNDRCPLYSAFETESIEYVMES